MKFGLSYLATSKEQLEAVLNSSARCIEGVIFDRSDLQDDRWKRVWNVMERAAQSVERKRLSFHFPVNHSDYVSDSWIRMRLEEAYQRVCDLGIAGVVIHANRIRSIEEWQRLNPSDDRARVIEALSAVKSRGSGSWLALENMPLMDNDLREIDPTFVFPKDFKDLHGTGVSVVWDVCHYFNSVATVRAVNEGAMPREIFPNFNETPGLLGFAALGEQIAHWHFSAFEGIPNTILGTRSTEGHLPWTGTWCETPYREALKAMSTLLDDSTCIFEVRESDYTKRDNGNAAIEWARNVLTSAISLAS